MVTSAPKSVTVHRGDILGGRYRVEGVIGAGSMGLVLCARQLDLDRLVAVKVLLPEMVVEESVERLRREARALARLTTSHVSRLLDVGELNDSGTPFIVMEFLEGQDLAKVLRERGPLAPLPIEMVVRLALDACEALTEAHDAGIIHRDIKPSNLFLARTPGGMTELKVLDFGISKFTSQKHCIEKALTGASQLLGSPVYMSPEQLRATRDVDARTDVWSLGVVLYELLCGRRPFQGNSVPDVCVRILAANPPLPASLRSDLPEALSAVVLRCLEKDPSRRYASIAELAAALAPFVEAHAHAHAHAGGSNDPVVNVEPLLPMPPPTLPVVVPPAKVDTDTVVDLDLVSTSSAWWRKRILSQAQRRRQGAIAIACIAVFGAAALAWSKTDEELTTTKPSSGGFALVSMSPSSDPILPAPTLSPTSDRVKLKIESTPSSQRGFTVARSNTAREQYGIAASPPAATAHIEPAHTTNTTSSTSTMLLTPGSAPRVTARDPGY